MKQRPLSETHPEIAKQAFGWDPSEVTYGMHKKLDWICDKKHVWSAVVKSRTILGASCPYCTNQKVLLGYNDLSTMYPDLASEADGWDPKTITSGSLHYKRRW